MRVKNTTQRFEVFVRDLQESFWGDFQGRTREMLKRLLESHAEQQMADYLGLKWHERAKPVERVDYRNGFCERDYVTPWEGFACAFHARGNAPFCRVGSDGSSGAPRKWPS